MTKPPDGFSEHGIRLSRDCGELSPAASRTLARAMRRLERRIGALRNNQGLAPLRGSQQDLCANCGQRPGTVQWGDAFAFTHGGMKMWCELCATRAQLSHAEERAALIPEMRARIAELEASSPVPSEEQP